MRVAMLAGLAALAACGPERPDNEAGPFTPRADHERAARDPGPHAFRTAPYVGKRRHEAAFAQTCLARDSASAHEPDPRSRAALEGLLRLAAGERVDRNAVFAPGFRIKPFASHDIIVQHELGDFLAALKGTVAVDYRHSRFIPTKWGTGYRYLARAVDFETVGGANEYYPVSYDAYTCGEIHVDLEFDGPTQQFRIAGLTFGPAERWRTIRRIGGRIDSTRSVAMYNAWLRTKRLPAGF